MRVVLLVLFLTGCTYVAGDVNVYVNDADTITVRDNEGIKLPLP